MTRREWTPHPWQVPMTEHLLAVERGALFCPMGSGKTSSTLTAGDLTRQASAAVVTIATGRVM